MPPLGVLVAAVVMERHEARAEAHVIGWAIGRDPAIEPEALRLLLDRACTPAVHWCEALAADGRVIAAGGDPSARGASCCAIPCRLRQPGRSSR